MEYDQNNVFAKILRGDLPCDKVYEDDFALAFRDINPAAPVHILVIPKREIISVGTMTDADVAVMGHLMQVCQTVARQEGLTDFRLVANSGAGAGQSVFHLHFHVLGGRSLSWPPG